jgi:uncharacterized repeat protein (TIGR03806 family)
LARVSIAQQITYLDQLYLKYYKGRVPDLLSIFIEDRLMKKLFSTKYLHVPALLLCSALLSACGGSGDSADATSSPDIDTNPAICTSDNTEVNWEALLTENCENLSDYNLFTNATDPTSNPNGPGIPYDLSTALFTDYATKYRFVFVPDGETATYSEHEVMEFPVGSVLVKTFALPGDTSNRDGVETIVETRLLINRTDGWTALPYYWETTSDAEYVVAGKTVRDVTITHNDAEITFDYSVPQKNQCTKCHTVAPILDPDADPEATVLPSIFKPIGPKSRYLNHDYAYAAGTQNQLLNWTTAGILTGAPADKSTIDTAADFNDETDITGLTSDELDLAARSYLDINCAHCHRSELTLPDGYAGPAGNSGLQMEFNRTFIDAPSKFGVCKTSIVVGNPAYPKDVIPGNSAESYLPFRMGSLEGDYKMPQLGRSSIHAEGVTLIKAWIDNMPADSCNL